MVLWVIFAGLAAATLIAVLYPFLRSKSSAPAAADYDTAVFKDQLQEIAAEEERGVISKTEAEAARTEVSRRLLAAAGGGKKKKTKLSTSQSGSAVTVALICAFLFVPVGSTALYLIYGSPGFPDQPLAARLKTPDGSQNVAALVGRVEARLREHPEDGRGWEVLAPVYLRQRRFSDAANAYGKVARLLGATPQRLIDYGNALVLANNGVVSERARKILQRALDGDDSFIRAHFWLAVAKEQDGQFAEAAEAWRNLLKKGDGQAPWHEAVKQRLAAVEEKTGSSAPKPSKPETRTARAGSGPEKPEFRGPTREDIAAAGQLSASDRSAMVNQMVSGLADRLKSEGGSVDEWRRLIRSYMVLGDKQAAAKALSNARSAYANDQSALASLGEFAAIEEKAGSPGPKPSKPETRTAQASSGPEKPELRGPTQDDISAAGQMSASDRSAMIKQMVSGLAERLKSDGGSVDEWKRLVRSYMVLGDKQAAEKALSAARSAYANDQSALASLGELASSLGL
ncbi:MAG: c-type cytochrome biogenesis protein CcmI [Hyphomicrobiaceae bacterium]|nr:c-type cytochrome biogenesis protein CcmI [Hyphomicrobiaceae bacterium]